MIKALIHPTPNHFPADVPAMKRILIVDDHPDIRSVIRQTLEQGDFEIEEAGDGLEGLQQARAWRPDVLVLDVMMPGQLDGFEVCRRIRQDAGLAATRVVFLSARSSDGDRERGLAAGASAYLVKPFSPLQLLQLIDHLLQAPDAAAPRP